jgi:magnesium transporter
MLEELALENGTIVARPGGAIRVFTDPSPDERAEIRRSCELDDHALDSMLDPEEVPRVELLPEHVLVIWKRANPTAFRAEGRFLVCSMGVVMQGERVTFIAAHDPPDLRRTRTRPITTPFELVLRELLQVVHQFNGHLRAIKGIAHEIQDKLNRSISNEHLLRMFALSESLVYYISAIETNGGVLSRLEHLAGELGLSAMERGLLDDLVIENNQAGRQAEVYSLVMSGLMDARGNIINNNMNVLLKNLTVINVVFLPLGVLAGIGGMSEYSMMTRGVSWWISYPLFLAALTAIGILTWRGLRGWMDRSMGGRSDRR